MKILYVTTISSTVNAFLIPHIRMLIAQGHQVDLAFNVTQEVDPVLNDLCIVHKVDFQRSPLTKKNYIAYRQLKKVIQDNQYALVHTHTPVASFLTRLVCKNFPNVKVLYTAHGFHFFKGAPLRNWLIYYPLERLAAKLTDGIITINQEDYESAKKFKLRNVNSVFITNGVGIDYTAFSNEGIDKKRLLRERYGYKSEDFILFYAAELNYNKHQDLLIDVISILKNSIPNIKLLLAGEGDLAKQYKDKVKKLGLSNSVEFLGFRRDIPNLLNLSDIAVSASRREGLPVNIMEAMAVGLPCVVTKCRGNEDLVINGKNGFVIKSEDKECFVNVINTLYKSQRLREEFGNASLELSKQYSLDNILDQMNSIYSKLLFENNK